MLDAFKQIYLVEKRKKQQQVLEKRFNVKLIEHI